jgi:hypothetical protein
MVFNEIAYPLRIRFGVIAKSPSNGLVDKEFVLAQVVFDHLCKQLVLVALLRNN